MNLDRPAQGDSVHSRAVSSFPLSIGTGLAFESLFNPQIEPYDPNREIPNHIDVTKYSQIWINIHTLFRNLISSISKEAFEKTSAEELTDVLLQEMDVINSLFQIEGQNLCQPKYYYCDYGKLHRSVSPLVKFRMTKSPVQKKIDEIMDKVCKRLSKASDEIFHLDSEIKPLIRCKALIMTHHPYDLVSHKYFSQLDLLESNTGKLKPRNLWYTKYYPVPNTEMSMLPLTRKLAIIFGDKYLLHPTDLRLRKLIIDIAMQYQWTPMTTSARVMLSLEMGVKEPYVWEQLKKL
jgi:hypothetical protein